MVDALHRTNEFDAKLASSSFATYRDVLRFLEWYESAESVTEYDKQRAKEAAELVRLHDAIG